jgi:hypothetical protein
MVAVHDPEMIRDEQYRSSEGADVLRDNNPALCHGSFQHPLIIDAPESRPVRR